MNNCFGPLPQQLADELVALGVVWLASQDGEGTLSSVGVPAVAGERVAGSGSTRLLGRGAGACAWLGRLVVCIQLGSWGALPASDSLTIVRNPFAMCWQQLSAAAGYALRNIK